MYLQGFLYGTGLFCFFNYQNKQFPVLIVNNHLIYEEFIKKNITISLELNNENKQINIKDNRIIYTNQIYDIIIIDIYNFLELDENIFKGVEEMFNKQSIYTLQFEKKSIIWNNKWY